ncbi:putative cupin superfamily protein [Paraburkholderia eburnea]|uniref:Putative cupin superfamily protein n=1 Tax=Paraburkholderia eburnea TaxID=1189126 RepID=A0A2S4MAP7_9BURK|nr:cupin domain-containing protein [Paraburkholderia eburnea]POR51715.1 putative cupin superfamily protein [Paraburkholderia eburnea]PRZ22746.1 putative cupin superfamily protein [Paraburkholderia eburnea]
MQRPSFIKHWTLLEEPDAGHYANDTERMGLDAPLSQKLGLTRFGIHHIRLLPGRRTSYPHAESAEEEFVHVVEGTPDVWIDGHLHRLQPGDSVGFPAGTGICHSFLNNTREEVRLIVIGETPKPENRIRYPLNASYESTRKDKWTDWPDRPLGPHDGKAKVE